VKIINAHFLKSITGPDESAGNGLPEICFIGRSNVGKSSAINSLVQRKIAKTSSAPGATKTINLFKVELELSGQRRPVIFSDFPGFGFSKVSKAVSQGWKTMIEGYILGNPRIRDIIWLFDIRREIDSLDEMLMEWLYRNKLTFSFVLTKSDKESQAVVSKKRRFFHDYFPGKTVFIFSSRTGQGKKELTAHLIGSIV